MPHDPFGDLESLFSEGELGVTRGADAPKGKYTPTRKEAAIRDASPAAQHPPTRQEPLGLYRPGDRLPTQKEEVAEDAAVFRPTQRPPMALLCCLDDGQDDGEWQRIRTDRFVIGRTEGDLLIPHDSAIAARHAEITRSVENGKHVWHLTDLHSATGIFVLVQERPIKHGVELWLGSRRYRFEHPEGTATPLLAEIGGDRRIVLDPPSTVFGRAMVPVDPCLGKPHCRFDLQANGQWKVTSLGARNGTWIRTERVRFVANCRFQLGEQRFYVEVVP